MSREMTRRGPAGRPRFDPRLKKALPAAYLGLLSVLFLASWRASRANRGLAAVDMEAWREMGDEELLR